MSSGVLDPKEIMTFQLSLKLMEVEVIKMQQASYWGKMARVAQTLLSPSGKSMEQKDTNHDS
jgi:hypothetical protein